MTADSGHSPPPESEPDQPQPRVEPEPPSAKAEKSRWPGWIWGIPIAAVLIVAWLAFKQLTSSGPLVTVIFPGAQGISAGQTEVQYEGLKVGQVESVRLEKDLRHVRADIRMQPEMEKHIGPGTEFWINGPSLTDLSSIRSVISGPTIGMQPRPGAKQEQYQGLAEPPVIPEPVPGQHYVLHAGRLGSASRGSQLYFHDMAVGTVESTKLNPDRTFDLQVFVRSPYDRFVHDGTRFWNAGAVQVSLQSAGPRIQLQSLPALLQGAIDFETPSGVKEGPAAREGHAFQLYDSKTAAEFAPGSQAVLYRAVLGPDAGSLEPNAAVKLAGQQVGTVQSAQLQYDPDSGTLREEVTLAIQPSRIALPAGASWPASGRTEMDAAMRRLIAQGLRAQAGSSIPLVGPKDVELIFVQQAKPATLLAGDPPQIPSAPGGSGLDGIMTAVSGIAGKLQGLPLDQIADNIRTITARLATLSQSPELTRSLQSLNRTLANAEQVTASAKADVPAVLAALRNVATQAERTVASANRLISTTAGNGPIGTNSAGLSQTLYQLSRAAESVRELTDYLNRHPSALIRGRG
jgi:paraquat-inducible protein B